MLTELASREKVVGVKQSRKAIREGRAVQVFLACDADPAVVDPIRADCEEQNVPLQDDCSMSELGEACGIAVGAAVAVLLK